MNIQDGFPLGSTGWISSQFKHSQESSPIPQFKSISSSALSFPYGPALTSIHMTTGKTIALTRYTFVGKVMSLLFNMLSRLVITFLPRNKCLLISWLQPPSAVILKPKKIKFCQCFHCLPIYLPSPSLERLSEVWFEIMKSSSKANLKGLSGQWSFLLHLCK